MGNKRLQIIPFKIQIAFLAFLLFSDVSIHRTSVNYFAQEQVKISMDTEVSERISVLHMKGTFYNKCILYAPTLQLINQTS